MTYPEELEYRIDGALAIFPKNIYQNFSKKRMFGGLAYLYKGKMTVGIIKKDLMVRIVSTKMENYLEQEHVRPMDFTKKAMKEFVFISPDGCKTEEQLQNWIELGLEHAKSKLKSL